MLLCLQGSGVASNGSVSPQSQSQAEAAAVGLPVAQTNGKKEVVRVDMTPEEVAFMRSLGWEEEADDADGESSFSLPIEQSSAS